MNEIHYLKPSQIRPDPENVYTHADGDIQRLVHSIQEHGFLEPLVVDASSVSLINGEKNYELVGGEARLEAAQAVGLTEIPCTIATFRNHEQRSAAAVALNAQYGTFNTVKLSELLVHLESVKVDLDDTGLPPYEIDSLMSTARDKEDVDPDDVPEPPEEPVTKHGDLIICGNHRLLCGDSTNKADIERLMDGGQADLIWTDPPYGLNYTGGAKKQMASINDHAGTNIYSLFMPHLQFAAADHAAMYLWFIFSHPATAAAIECGYEIDAEIIWLKNNAQFVTNAHFKLIGELCFYAHRKGKTARWYGPNNEVNVWEVDRANRNDFHPTQKPVALAERAYTNSSKAGDIVLDLFGGGGTAMIAAESMGRKARLMELEPKYADVIVSRWETFSGKKAQRVTSS